MVTKMRNTWFYKKRSHSVFTKIIHVLLLTGLLVEVILTLFFQFHFSSRLRQQNNQNFQNYYNYIAKELHSPPDTILARQIAARYAIRISYTDKNGTWQVGEVSASKSNRLFQLVSGAFNDNEFVVHMNDGGTFVFTSDAHSSLHPRTEEFAILAIGLLLVLVLAHYLIRQILKPIKLLEVGVQQISAGNFSHEIPVKGSDELTMLSNSFNEMKQKIVAMIVSRDQLLLDVSHELRSPLTRIKLALELIANEQGKARISEDIREMEIMISDILESERLKNKQGSLKLSEINFSQLVLAVVNEFDGKPMGIVKFGLTESILLQLDSEMMKVAVRNVIENALKYSHAQSKPVTVSLAHDENKVLLKIKDDGIGIPSEDLAFVFEPFYRADRARSKKIKGYGLGLSLCHRIIEAHGGQIHVANNLDRGVTVTIVFNKC